MPVIDGEVKEKVYSVIADSIDVLRLYQSAARQVEAQSVEIAILEDRCDVLERSFGDTAALEHTVAELQERNDRLRLRNDVLEKKNAELEHRLSTEPPADTSHQPSRIFDTDNPLWWQGVANAAKAIRAEVEAELERYKAAVVALRDAVYRYVTTETFVTIQSKAIEYLKEVGYDIEHEEGQEVPEIAAPVGSEDSTAGADEHDFL